jgi:hypothetical protein
MVLISLAYIFKYMFTHSGNFMLINGNVVVVILIEMGCF